VQDLAGSQEVVHVAPEGQKTGQALVPGGECDGQELKKGAGVDQLIETGCLAIRSSSACSSNGGGREAERSASIDARLEAGSMVGLSFKRKWKKRTTSGRLTLLIAPPSEAL
jgi:hypothetical protein